ncbi:MAG TPA: S24/S26 family peptidase [Opitutaceae bacterium]|nr:S24/S26 family peptidase [Opitutaceae bacterium]
MHTRRLVLLTLPAAALFGLIGCTSTSVPAVPTPGAASSQRELWHDAELLAAREPGRDVLLGAGESMAPVYGDGSVLVIRPMAYAELRAGMTVVYLNREGRRIAHRLWRQEENGWRARGLNNAEPDTELVTAENLVGVVYASLAREPAEGTSAAAK